MAAPHVAGVAALVKAAGVKEPDEILNVLKQSSRVVKEDPLNHFGAGHLDAAAAVKITLGRVIWMPPPLLNLPCAVRLPSATSSAG